LCSPWNKHKEIFEQYHQDGLEENYCRNPGQLKKNIFCFTGDNDEEYELCEPLETCKEYHIVSEKGMCEKCPKGFFPDEKARECREVELAPF